MKNKIQILKILFLSLLVIAIVFLSCGVLCFAEGTAAPETAEQEIGFAIDRTTMTFILIAAAGIGAFAGYLFVKKK